MVCRPTTTENLLTVLLSVTFIRPRKWSHCTCIRTFFTVDPRVEAHTNLIFIIKQKVKSVVFQHNSFFFSYFPVVTTKRGQWPHTGSIAKQSTVTLYESETKKSRNNILQEPEQHYYNQLMLSVESHKMLCTRYCFSQSAIKAVVDKPILYSIPTKEGKKVDLTDESIQLTNSFIEICPNCAIAPCGKNEKIMHWS